MVICPNKNSCSWKPVPSTEISLGPDVEGFGYSELSCKSWAEDASTSSWIMLMFHCCSVDSVDLRMYFYKP